MTHRLAPLAFALAFTLMGTAPAVADTISKPTTVRKATTPKAAPKKKTEVPAKKSETPAVALATETAKPTNNAEVDAAGRLLAAYTRGKSLESVNRRLAMGAYREAAQQGHGPSQKRLWEMLKDTPGSESVATVYQMAAWNQHVPGVTQPLAPLRYN